MSRYDHARDTVRALNRLLQRSARRRENERKLYFEKDRLVARSLFADANILGFGVGPKISNESKYPSKTCLVFFVRKKLPKSRLRYGVEIPKEFHLRTIGESVQTDVQVWSGLPVAHRSVSAGSSVGDLLGNAGTVTLAVTEKSTGNPLILGCSHVMARCGLADVGANIESPGGVSADPDSNIVAKLRRFTVIDPASFNNSIDAAVALPMPGIALSNSIPGIGTPAGIRDLTGEGDAVVDNVQVKRMDISLRLQSGTIRNIHVSTAIAYPQLPGDPSVNFVELVQYDASSNEGDSGAAVVDVGGNNVVGMHIAGDRTSPSSFFAHIQWVLDRMNAVYP